MCLQYKLYLWHNWACMCEHVNVFCARVRAFTHVCVHLSACACVCAQLRVFACVCIHLVRCVRARVVDEHACVRPCVSGRVNAHVCAFFRGCSTMPGFKWLGKKLLITPQLIKIKSNLFLCINDMGRTQAFVLVPKPPLCLLCYEHNFNLPLNEQQ